MKVNREGYGAVSEFGVPNKVIDASRYAYRILVGLPRISGIEAMKMHVERERSFYLQTTRDRAPAARLSRYLGLLAQIWPEGTKK